MLDYLEGNLSPQDTLALKAFAVLHPELDLNFDEELIALENETMSFKGKQHLKANFNDELVIGYMENVLDANDKQLATELAKKNNAFKHELNLYKKTIASADTTIVFENKAALKRQPKVILFNTTISLRIAAAILLLFGIWFLVSRLFINEGTVTTKLAKKKETIVPIDNKQLNSEKQLEENISEPQLIAKTNSQKNKTTVRTANSSTINNASKENSVSTNSVQFANKPDEPINPERIIYIDTNALKLANNTFQEKTTTKYIIEEGTDDDIIASVPKPNKNKFWGYAAKALKKLNQKGIEKVNGSENTNELFLGALTISKTN